MILAYGFILLYFHLWCIPAESLSDQQMFGIAVDILALSILSWSAWFSSCILDLLSGFLLTWGLGSGRWQLKWVTLWYTCGRPDSVRLLVSAWSDSSYHGLEENQHMGKRCFVFSLSLSNILKRFLKVYCTAMCCASYTSCSLPLLIPWRYQNPKMLKSLL